MGQDLAPLYWSAISVHLITPHGPHHHITPHHISKKERPDPVNKELTDILKHAIETDCSSYQVDIKHTLRFLTRGEYERVFNLELEKMECQKHMGQLGKFVKEEGMPNGLEHVGARVTIHSNRALKRPKDCAGGNVLLFVF